MRKRPLQCLSDLQKNLKVRFIKQVTSFVEDASITHRKVRGYIFQERVGCEQKQYNASINMADKSRYGAYLLILIFLFGIFLQQAIDSPL